MTTKLSKWGKFCKRKLGWKVFLSLLNIRLGLLLFFITWSQNWGLSWSLLDRSFTGDYSLTLDLAINISFLSLSLLASGIIHLVSFDLLNYFLSLWPVKICRVYWLLGTLSLPDYRSILWGNFLLTLIRILVISTNNFWSYLTFNDYVMPVIPQLRVLGLWGELILLHRVNINVLQVLDPLNSPFIVAQVDDLFFSWVKQVPVTFNELEDCTMWVSARKDVRLVKRFREVDELDDHSLEMSELVKQVFYCQAAIIFQDF